MKILAFNKWDTEGIVVNDIGLRPYINLTARYSPKTSGKHVGVKFHKSKVFIVERMMNKLMMPGHKARKHKLSSGHSTGKGQTVYKVMEEALKIVEQKTKKNPIQVLVTAIENAAPREEIISIEYGGARYPKAVETSPQRRIDYALRLMVQGAFQKTFNTKKKAVNAVADEILAAFNLSPNSGAIAKKLELERQADSAR